MSGNQVRSEINYSAPGIGVLRCGVSFSKSAIIRAAEQEIQSLPQMCAIFFYILLPFSQQLVFLEGERVIIPL